MYLKLTLPILLFSLMGCSHTLKPNETLVLKGNTVRTYLDGTWVIRKTAKTPELNGVSDSKYYDYYSALHAHTIGCKSYSQIELKVAENEKAYKCVANGQYLTEKTLAIGTPWQ